MDHTETFNSYRPLLFSIAYRMLGTVMDAEDILQESFLRWQNVSVEKVDEPRAYLSSVVTRLCIDQLRSARVRREEYIGPWLPEPLIMTDPTPIESMILAETLSTAFLVLLEKLNPIERAVYLLREVFDYSYSEIAGMVDKTEDNCRQIFNRAKRFISSHRPRFEPDPEQERRLTSQFLHAVANGDMDSLLETLAEDIVVYSDGGGKVFAAKKPIIGADLVARFFLRLGEMAPSGYEVYFAQSNGMPAIINIANGVPYSVLVFRILDEKIQNVFSVSNPEKLKRVKGMT